jgi:hypothetical protein
MQQEMPQTTMITKESLQPHELHGTAKAASEYNYKMLTKSQARELTASSRI